MEIQKENLIKYDKQKEDYDALSEQIMLLNEENLILKKKLNFSLNQKEEEKIKVFFFYDYLKFFLEIY